MFYYKIFMIYLQVMLYIYLTLAQKINPCNTQLKIDS